MITRRKDLKVNESDTKEKWYLPNFPVIKPDRETIKVRVVFDVSVKENGKSMNDIIHTGPRLRRDIVEALLQFRRFSVALVGDVAQMYLCLGIAPKYQPDHWFLWRDLNENRVPDLYEFSRLVFGVNSCPFQAPTHAKKNKELYPRAAETILESKYIDDSINSTETESEVIQLCVDLSRSRKTPGMHARKWISNSTKVLVQIQCEDWADGVEILEKHLPDQDSWCAVVATKW